MQQKNLLQKKRKVGNCNKSKFLRKLFKILNNDDYSNCIRWSDDGSSFIISNKFAFENNVLTNFNHNNFSSFIRQLNNYNFHNISLDKGEIKYQHDEFNKNKSLDEILLIKKQQKIIANPKHLKNLKAKNKYYNNLIIEKKELSSNLNQKILKNILLLEKNINNQVIINEKFDTLINQNNKIIELLNNFQKFKQNETDNNHLSIPLVNDYDENTANIDNLKKNLIPNINLLKFSYNSRISKISEFN